MYKSKIKPIALILLMQLFFSLSIFGQGRVTGTIINKSDREPIEFVTVEARTIDDNRLIDGAITDNTGRFEIAGLPFGEYELRYSFIGFVQTDTVRFVVSRENPAANVGTLELDDTMNVLDEFVVIGQRSIFETRIDRRIFHVGEDVMSVSSSVSDLMRHIPSIDVDVEGNVSLRGSESVQILINGRRSRLVQGAGRAMALQQLPASAIERIEIMTNPPARYRPDGTSGIINIIMRRERRPGVNGMWTANAGNEHRYNSTLFLNYNPGSINFFASYGIRLDNRGRETFDSRTRLNTKTEELSHIEQNTFSRERPLTHLTRGGFSWDITPRNMLEVGVSYSHRGMSREGETHTILRDHDRILTDDRLRLRSDREFERDFEISAEFTHVFGEDRGEFTLEFEIEWERDSEDNLFTNQFRFPLRPETSDRTFVRERDREMTLHGNYSRPLGDEGELEIGFLIDTEFIDIDFRAEYLDNGIWQSDLTKSNRFASEQNIYALYVTYETEFGNFGIMGGLRAEYARITTHQKTDGTITPHSYFNLFPSLHLSYRLSERNTLLLNYSLRINRPSAERLNPFALWSDPFNVSTGNPLLEPAKIHSFEFGYMFRSDVHTFMATAYHRHIFNQITSVTRYGFEGNPLVLWTSLENLSSSQSSGLEFIFSSRIGSAVRFNLSSNVFYNVIDASNLGYSENQSTVAWNAGLNAHFNITRNLMAQLNTRYTAKTLTPQGYRQPSYIMNLGARYNFLNNRASLLFTVSDVFNSFRQVTVINIDSPNLLSQNNEEVLVSRRIEHRRTSQIFNLGFVYRFGRQQRPVEVPLRFDETI